MSIFSSPFTRALLQMVAVAVLSIFSFILYASSEKQIDHANENRLYSYMLADELRQSSDDLTRMVRTYIATGNPIYKQHYQEILDIRNGKIARPFNYQNVYWDLVDLQDKRPRPHSDQMTSLIDRMKAAGFTPQEFAKLSEAKNNSDVLTRTEFTAMKLIESKGDETQRLRNKAQAIELLHNADYHRAKASIMRPIETVNQLMSIRTDSSVRQAQRHAMILRTVFVGMVFLLLIMLWRLHKTLGAMLGSSVDNVHSHILKIGKGDFSEPITVEPSKKNSILGWLSETQITLQSLMAHNERLKNLYASLSQCNQAIVRCQNEDELFPLICESAVQFAGLSLAWIGTVDAENGTIKPVAFAGEGADYLHGILISTDPENPMGRGPTGQAFHTLEPYWCQNFLEDPNTLPWHEKGQKFGWKSSAAIPILRNGTLYGIITLYSSYIDMFDDDAKRLLEEMASDIAFAMEGYERKNQQKEAEEQIRYLANFDKLTGLPNRSQLDFMIRDLLSMAKRQQKQIAVMFLDLDRFKDINDTLGHSVGDTLLIKSALRLTSLLREEDTVSRLGGDEFMVLIPSATIEGAAHIAQKILSSFKKPFQIENHELSVSTSIGIALYPNDGLDFETLYKNADTAMYRAKHEGRDTFCFFTEEMQYYSARNLELGNALRHAIEKNQMKLHYQPQISAKDGSIVGVEALLRWTHPRFGVVSPVEFIPIAEEYGMILSIGEWVLRGAIEQAKIWMDQGNPPLLMAVNLSAAQFRSPNLPLLVTQILDDVGLPAEYLELELTESVAMHDPQKAITVMNDLHKRGVRISIDDFGTGYSSLSYLKKFNIYKLKIDQSFVRDINIDPEDKAIVSAIIHMAQSLGLRTIAEGVETIGQLEYIVSQGCDEIQGFYYAKPLPPSEFEVFRKERMPNVRD